MPVAPAPAIVPPVARITMFGFLFWAAGFWQAATSMKMRERTETLCSCFINNSFALCAAAMF